MARRPRIDTAEPSETPVQENLTEPNKNPAPPVQNEPVPESQTVPKNSTVAEIAATLAGSMPDPQPHAIAAMREAEATNSENHTDTPSDAATPKKRGRPPGSKSKVSSKAQKTAASQGPVVAQNVPAPTDYKMMGATCAQMTFMLGQLVGGPEFAPQEKAPWFGDKSEREVMTEAYENYARAKQLPDLPPGVALSFAMICYVAPRFTAPITQSRIKKWGVWLKNVWLKMRGKKVTINGAQSSVGNDHERKDPSSEVAGGGAES